MPPIKSRYRLAFRSALLCWLGFTSFLGTAAMSHAEVVVESSIFVENEALALYTPQPTAAGNLVIAGSDNMQPLMIKLARAFSDRQPDVKTAVQGGGTEAAITGFITNQATFRRGDSRSDGHLVSNNVSLLAASRPLTERERQAFHSRYGYEVVEIPIAMDAVAIYVHHQNPIPGLSLEQVDAIFGHDRKQGYPMALTFWGDVGLQNGWESRPIHLYGRDPRSGTRSFFIETALLGGRIRTDVTEAAGSAVEVVEMSQDPLAIGYAGSGFQSSGVRMVPIAPKAGMDFVVPSVEAAVSGSYPLARPLYLYARKVHQGGDDSTLAFLKFVNSREGQRTVARAGFYPLSNAQLVHNLKTLGGSYLSAKGVTTAH